jgi:hypothetical protein
MMRGKNRKRRRLFRRGLVTLLFLVFAGGLLYFFHPAVLTAGGRYLAPEGAGKADVVILEGSELVKEQAVKIGMGLISSGRANGLVVVYQDSENEKAFGKPADYTLFLMQKIGDLGLKKDQIKILPVPQEHPITLNEARVVLSHLSGDKIQSAILVTEDFHSRRSYWVYKKVGTPLRIEIIPYPYFSRFKVDGWWQQARGVRNFAEESVKFFYYLLRGYVPLKSLVVT